MEPSNPEIPTAAQETLARYIREERIRPVFQPIVDLFSGEIFGYEIFSRADPPFEDPRFLFEKALEWGLAMDLDFVCRAQACRGIATFSDRIPHKKFFINICPHVFNDERFQKGFTLSKLAETGLNQRRIALEISETAPVHDYAQFDKMIRHYYDQGFAIALDNFGAGHNGLITLVAASPNYVKLDAALISGIDAHVYKQHLVKSVRSFASNVESIVIAQGVETMRELETLIRLGVRFAQGYLLGRPLPQPEDLDKSARQSLREFFQQFHYPRVLNEDSIVNIMMRPPTIEPGTKTCAEMDRFFRQDAAVDHVVFIENDRPAGILPRQHFYTSIGGPFGFSLFQEKKADDLAKTAPLSVNERMEITELGRLAMTRSREDVYDPVVVTDEANRFLGTITMKQLLYKFINFEIRIAADSNPLTNLPGNRIINQWLQEILENPPFTIIYADLDRFKEYNDIYGFAQGDKMIQLAAQILSTRFDNPAHSQRIGHLGGDDFIVISRTICADELLDSVCGDFDREKKRLFRPEDVQRNFYQAENREGNLENIPLVTMTLAVVTSENIKGRADLELVAQIAASLKKRAKSSTARSGKSGFLLERRIYD